MSDKPFNKLVKLAARAFYDDIPKAENLPKSGKGDNRGIAVVVLDALTRRQWVREEDLAKDLKLHSKQLRRILRFFEEEKLVTRDHRKETAKGAKIYSAAVAAAAADAHTGRDGEEKIKLHTHSYCCLDYAQIYDVLRYRLHRMKKNLKDEIDNKDTIQEYICPNCSRRYTALDACQLVSQDLDHNFHCENCNGELVAVSDKLAAQEMGDGDDNARSRRSDKVRDQLKKMEDELKPLMDQLNRVKDLQVPEFGTLQAWEVQANAAARAANGGSSANDLSKSSQGGYNGTPMPFLGETKVEVAFSGVDDKDNVKAESGSGSAPLKVLPPWMIKQGMNLTKEQRGEARQELTVEGASASVESSDDKKSIAQEDDAKNIQDEYFKAYYAALLQRQREQEEATKRENELPNTSIFDGVDATSSKRRVGMKSKRNDENEGEDDVEWEEEAPAAGETFKVNDPNVQADASGDDNEDDDIDWEEG